MPCPDCYSDLPLIYREENQIMLCENCQSIEVANEYLVESFLEAILDNFQAREKEEILGVVGDANRSNLILGLLSYQNNLARRVFEQGGTRLLEFLTIPYIVKKLYQIPRKEFGDEVIEPPFQSNDKIRNLIDSYTGTFIELRQAKEEFFLPKETPRIHSSGLEFLEDAFSTEYRYSYQRTLRSLLGLKSENKPNYYAVTENLRDFSRGDVSEVETPEEFGDAWAPLIVRFATIASLNQMANNVFETDFPDSVSVTDFKSFIEDLESLFSDKNLEAISQTGYLCKPKKSQIDLVGRKVFGSDWRKVKPKIIASEATIGEGKEGAHPILFQVTAHPDSDYQVDDSGYPGDNIQVLPLYHAKLMKYQMFLLLSNSNRSSGKGILDDLMKRYGTEYEKNFFEFLTKEGYETYLNATLTKSEPREIDIIRITNNYIDFIELKYLLPPLNIMSKEGIEEINKKFDGKVFDEDESGKYSTSISFPEKVDYWLDNAVDGKFSAVGPDGEKNYAFEDHLLDREVRTLVISNIGPSYPEKRDVRFLTDFEFYEMVKEGKDVFCDIV
jgi:hypothetical protein